MHTDPMPFNKVKFGIYESIRINHWRQNLKSSDTKYNIVIFENFEYRTLHCDVDVSIDTITPNIGYPRTSIHPTRFDGAYRGFLFIARQINNPFNHSTSYLSNFSFSTVDGYMRGRVGDDYVMDIYQFNEGRTYVEKIFKDIPSQSFREYIDNYISLNWTVSPYGLNDDMEHNNSRITVDFGYVTFNK